MTLHSPRLCVTLSVRYDIYVCVCVFVIFTAATPPADVVASSVVTCRRSLPFEGKSQEPVDHILEISALDPEKQRRQTCDL